MKKWIVVANAKRARVLEEPNADGSPGRPRYVHVAELLHPGRRRRGADARGGASARFGVASPGGDDDQYALEVARLLDQGVADGRCAGLVLIASHPVLGLLKGRLGAQASKVVLRSLAADFTALDEATLWARLAEAPAGAPAATPFFALPFGAVSRG